MNQTESIHPVEWPLPLCRKYALLNVSALPVRWRNAGAVRGHELVWVLGVLADGQYEVLGAWAEGLSSLPVWQVVFENLRDRGVEEIQRVVSSDADALQAALGAVYPHAVATKRDVGSPLAKSRHRTLLAAEETLQQLERLANRRIVRHGEFGGLQEAVAFVNDALVRAEQRLDAVADTVDLVAASGAHGVPTRRRSGGTRALVV